ncbi:MAG TPA: XRE family transcriptional regulator [Nitrospinaceae bacterium]|jgi:DNA-binding XRE family transcriptional regulator|nr:XRE family transcriptional regulator [Nitrospinaceae bacterium]
MNTPIDFQVIEENGKPAFAVIPYKEFLRLVEPEPTIPHEVVSMTIREELSLITAWRKYMGLSQVEVAKRMGITQAALSQIEHAERNKPKTLKQIAKALDLTIEQLHD